jgi:hypothetical protein
MLAPIFHTGFGYQMILLKQVPPLPPKGNKLFTDHTDPVFVEVGDVTDV